MKARDETPELFSAANAGPTVEVQELRALMRQEIEKYKNHLLPPAAAPAPANHTYASVEEDPYSTLEELSDIPATQAPEPPGKVPPLPPRNQHMMLAALPSDPLVIKEDDVDEDEGNQAEPELSSMVKLKSSASSNAALRSDMHLLTLRVQKIIVSACISSIDMYMYAYACVCACACVRACMHAWSEYPSLGGGGQSRHNQSKA